MRYCTKCVMPDTKPGLTLDEEGVCNACRTAEKKDKGIDWKAREKQLREILDKYRSKDGSNWDCVVGVSGGKDSYFIVHTLKEYGMDPLCVTFAPCKSTELGKRNLKNFIEKLGVDHIMITPKRDVYRKLFRLGLKMVGDSCMPCHYGIFTSPVKIAVKYNIPLIVWGENVQMEYGGPATDVESPYLDKKWVSTWSCPHKIDGSEFPPEEWVGHEGLALSDIKPYLYPSDEEIRRVGVTGIFLGYFVKWNIGKQLALIKEKYDFRTHDGPCMGTYADYENLDGAFVGVHDLEKYIKFGWGRATDHACTDVRYGLLTREEAVRLVRKYDGKYDNEESRKNFHDFLKFTGITEAEFWNIMDKWRSPKAWKKNEKGEWVKLAELE